MSSGTETVDVNLFSVEKYIASCAEDKGLNSRLFSDVQSVIDDDLSEKASHSFAESYGLVAKIIFGDWSELCNQNYPSIVKLIDGRYFLVIRANESGILLYDQGNSKSSIVTKDIFQARWTGQAVTFRQKTIV